MNPRPWFNWHSWAGFSVWILLSFVLVTGTLATVSTEIDWLFNPAMRNTGDVPDKLDWGALFDNAKATFPDDTVAAIIAPVTSFVNVQAIAIDKQGKRFRIFFDPATQMVVGTGRWLNWQRFFRQTHRHLMLPVQWGVTIVGLLAVPLFISFFSGFVIYRRWWQGFFKFPRRNVHVLSKLPIKRAHSYWATMHRWLGVWSLWFILLMAVTGSWYLAERWGLSARYPKLPEVKTDYHAKLNGDSLNKLIERAAQRYPNLDIKLVRRDEKHDKLVLLQGQAEAVLVRDRANQLAFNYVTGEMIDKRRGVDLSMHLRIAEAADPLHFGTLGGTATRYVWFVFGVALSTLSLSGVFLHGLRLMRSAPELRAKTAKRAWLAVWQQQHIIKWTTCFVVMLSLGLAVFDFIIT